MTNQRPDEAASQAAASPLAAVLAGRQGALGRMAVTGLLGGFAEALFLVIVTRAAFAITQDKERVGIVASWFLTVPETLLFALALVILRIGLAVFSSWQASSITTRAVADVRSSMATAFFGTTWPVQQGQESGSLQQLLASYSTSAGALVGGVGQVIITGGNLVAMLALAVAVDPRGAIVLVLSVGLLAAALRPLRRAVRDRARASTEVGMQFATSVSEVSELGLELHVFRVQHAAEQRVQDLIEESRTRDTRLAFVSSLGSPLYTGLAYLALLGSLGVVAASSSTNLNDLGAVMLIMLRSLGYGQAVQNTYLRIIQHIPPMQDYYAKLAIFHRTKEIDGHQRVERIGSLRAVDVCFEYRTNSPVLHDVSFEVEPNEIVGVIGPSGGGKSTLVQLLLGLREPTSGLILAGGRAVHEFDRDEWARKVTFVPQEAHMITGSIADNIRFLRDGISDDDIERAARLAHIHQEIVDLPDGYDYRLGAGGGRLSGGQKQRLCIARALVEHPDVLILDEPTSALDVHSEHLIRSTVRDLKSNMSVIVIAHRLSTLDICDRIMVIQGGRVMGIDTPENLEKSNEFYRDALRLSGLR